MDHDLYVRMSFFNDGQERWNALGDSMDQTSWNIKHGERIPPFSERIPQNLRSFGEAANRALDAYLGALDKGSSCAFDVGSTLMEAGRSYLRHENYSEEEIKQIERELDE